MDIRDISLFFLAKYQFHRIFFITVVKHCLNSFLFKVTLYNSESTAYKNSQVWFNESIGKLN